MQEIHYKCMVNTSLLHHVPVHCLLLFQFVLMMYTCTCNNSQSGTGGKTSYSPRYKCIKHHQIKLCQYMYLNACAIIYHVIPVCKIPKHIVHTCMVSRGINYQRNELTELIVKYQHTACSVLHVP